MNLDAVVARIKQLDRFYQAAVEAQALADRYPDDPALARRARYYARQYWDLVDSYDPHELGLA